MNFYENFLNLCVEKGISPSRAALEMGISKSAITRWKTGGGITDATARIIADYFGVATESLFEKNTGENSSNRIRELRKKNKLTMKELGKQVGVVEGTISQYETGKRQPDIEMLSKLANYFGVTIDYLVGGAESENAEAPLSTDEKNLLDMFKSLSSDEKSFIETMVKSLMDRRK